MSEQTQAPMTNLTCSRCGYVMTGRTIGEGFPLSSRRARRGRSLRHGEPGREGSSGKETKSSIASLPIRRECRSRQST